MARCEVCGNDYHRAFEVHQDGNTHVFDSFECAIHRLAPLCAHCGCHIVGHGLENNSRVYCCAHCARNSGVSTLVDNTASQHSTDPVSRRLS